MTCLNWNFFLQAFTFSWLVVYQLHLLSCGCCNQSEINRKSCLRAFLLSFSKYVLAVAMLLSTYHINIILIGGSCFGMWQTCWASRVTMMSYCGKFLSQLYSLSLSKISLFREGIPMKYNGDNTLMIN